MDMKLLSEMQRQILETAATNVADVEGDLCMDFAKDLAKINPHTDATKYDQILNEIMDLRNSVIAARGFVKYIHDLALNSKIMVNTLISPSLGVIDKGLEMLIDQYADNITEPLYPGSMMSEASVGFTQDQGVNKYTLSDASLAGLRQQVLHNVDLYVTAIDLLNQIRAF
jgi:hypothetical protein